MRLNLFCIAFITLTMCSCKFSESNVRSSYMEEGSINVKLDEYWYQGKAEVTTYDLRQNRYQDTHPGEVVLIFVTEDFLTDLQVKNDNYTNPNSTGILKTNKIKRFTTGIYDYSIMTSVFTPTNRNRFPNSLKVTCASQDWCGQSFQQLNLKNNLYESTVHSYFENEADEVVTTGAAILEDELMNLLRMDPALLPVGSFKLIPALEYQRLKHKSTKPVKAVASLKKYDGDDFDGSGLMCYRVDIASESKIIEIVYENVSPYKIEGWTISYPSAFDGSLRKTIATRKGEKYIPYWKNNVDSDAVLRKDLNLIY